MVLGGFRSFHVLVTTIYHKGISIFFVEDTLYSRGCMLEEFGWQNLPHVKWYPFQEKIPHIFPSSRELIKFGSVLDQGSQNPNAIGSYIGVLKKSTLPKTCLFFKHKTARSRDILSELYNNRCEQCNTESRHSPLHDLWVWAIDSEPIQAWGIIVN